MHNSKYITFLLTKLSRSLLQRIQYKLFCLAFMTFVWIFHNICPNLQAKWLCLTSQIKSRASCLRLFNYVSLHLECPLSTAPFPSLSIKILPSFKTLHKCHSFSRDCLTHAFIILQPLFYEYLKYLSILLIERWSHVNIYYDYLYTYWISTLGKKPSFLIYSIFFIPHSQNMAQYFAHCKAS